MKRLVDLPYGEKLTQRLDLYLPDGQTEAVLVYFHGGGLDSGDKEGSLLPGTYLAERGIAMISANYRMYPEANYPDFIEDAASAVAWAREYMRTHLKCERLYVGGTSAGAYLSMMLCFDPRYLSMVGIAPNDVSGYFHDAGQPTKHFRVLRACGENPRRVIVDETAPLYHVGTSPSYPPMRFIISDDDVKGRYEQTMLMLVTLSNLSYSGFDHVVMHGTHCAYWNRTDENGDSLLGGMMLDFIRHTENV